MVIYTKILINDTTTFRDFNSCKINKTMSDYNSVSSADINLDNERGCNKELFNIGEDIKIYVEKDVNPPTNIEFRGVIDKISYKGKEQNETIIIKCVDYTTYLKDNTVQPIVYTDDEISVIVKNIISNEIPSVTTTNVNTTDVTLERIGFNQISVFDALKQLSELADYYFYIDKDLDLHFEEKSSVSSGETLNNTNILNLSTNISRKDIINKLWVYGDKILTEVKEDFDLDGGSVISLNYKPHNTSIEITGGKIQGGGVYQMSNIPSSGERYLVNYDDQQVIFTSGTEAGDNIPASGLSGTILYYRNKPIVKYGERADSYNSYGVMEKVIVDKTIKDPNTAVNKVNSILNRCSNPLSDITINVDGIISLTPGNTIIVNMPNHNLDNIDYEILKATYNLNNKTMMSEQVLSVTLNKKIPDILDTLKNIILNQKRVEAGEMDEADVYTRLQNAELSYHFFINEWKVSTKDIGSRFYLGSPVSKNGWLGSPGSYYLTSGALPETIIASGVI